MFIWDDVQRTLYDTDGHAFYSAIPDRNAAFDDPCCMTNEIISQSSDPYGNSNDIGNIGMPGSDFPGSGLSDPLFPDSKL